MRRNYGSNSEGILMYMSDLMLLANQKLTNPKELSDCNVLLSSAETYEELAEISKIYHLEDDEA